jgi:hypothetical protein
MDLNDFNFKESSAQRMELLNPATEETLRGEDGEAIWIEVHSADSDMFRSAMRRYGNKKLQKGSKKQTVEEVEEVSCKILAEATSAWSNNLIVNGEHPECTAKNAEWLYEEYLWIREQVDKFVNERANFLTSA